VNLEGEGSKKNDENLALASGEGKKAKKQLTGVELIRENMKELNEVIGYMDFSFECAFTIQEKAFMLAYKVSTPSKLPQLSIYSVTPTRSNKTLTNLR